MIANKFRKNKKRTAGLTFTEILITTFILTLALGSIVLSFTKSTIFLKEIRENNIVNNALNYQIETVRGMDFDSILSLASTFTGSGFDQLNTPVGTVTVDDYASETDIRRLSVKVTWISASGRQMERNMVTLITREGIDKQ